MSQIVGEVNVNKFTFFVYVYFIQFVQSIGLFGTLYRATKLVIKDTKTPRIVFEVNGKGVNKSIPLSSVHPLD